MQYTTIKGNSFKVSRVALGTMRFCAEVKVNKDGSVNTDKNYDQVEAIIESALEQGINFLDTADVYGNGRSDELIGQYLTKHPERREQLFIQDKCGIYQGDDGKYVNNDGAYIKESVDKALARLHTDYLDSLLIHRPDQLMDPEDVAAAFDELYHAGKVRSFGVSNCNPMRIELLSKYVDQPIAICQMQLSPAHALILNSTSSAGRYTDCGIDRDGGIVDYCRVHDIRLMAYSILQGHHSWGWPSYINDPEEPKLNEVLDRLAKKYDCSKQALAAAWVLRLPAGIIPVVGTTNPVHLADTLKALDFELTRAEWYEIFTSAGNWAC